MPPKPPAPTHWVPISTSFPAARRVAALVDAWGAEGPWTLTVLMCDAGQRQFNGEGRGTAKGTFRLLATLVGTRDVERVRAIVEHIASLGFVELTSDAHAFAARFIEWDAWDRAPRSPTGAERQRRYRERHEASP